LNDQIAQLISLQSIDLELDKIDKEIRQEQEALEKRMQELAEKESYIIGIEEKITQLDKSRRILEDEMTDKFARVKERQSKMMQVQTGREQTALLKEIEDAKKSAKENEEQVVALMENIETLSAEVKQEKNLLKGEKQSVANETEKVRKAIEEIAKGKKTKSGAREQQAAEIAKQLYKKYSTLRQRRNGLAVVNVTQGVCQGCFMSLPPQQFNLLLRGDRLLDCPTCQRLIYHLEEESGE
jgi:predicted  nucleic acid-binding Zn-ribbon protein